MSVTDAKTKLGNRSKLGNINHDQIAVKVEYQKHELRSACSQRDKGQNVENQNRSLLVAFLAYNVLFEVVDGEA